jgi:cyclic pyranopterin phosphate synthase
MPLEPLPSNYTGEVASRYRYKGSGNEIGIISSITQPFCSDCTRLRLSPEGKLATCLFTQLGTDLKTPIRSGLNDDEITEMISNVWKNRSDRYSELRSSKKTNPNQPAKPKRVEMYKIGG